MQLIHALAAGISGAENGTALIYNRGGSSQISYYLGDGGFEGVGQVSAGTPVGLDSNGGAEVYVTQLARVVVKDEDGLEVRSFVVGNYDANTEVISPSFTGTDYATGLSGANKPTTLESVLDRLIESFGAIDFKVLSGGSATFLKDVISSLGDYLVSVKDYGAAGDGTANDTAAISAAAAVADSTGKILFFPPGTYRVTSAVALPITLGNVLGCGPESSTIEIDHASNAIFTWASSSNHFNRIEGLRFTTGQTHTGSLINITGSRNVEFVSCSFDGSNGSIGAAGTTGYVLVGTNSITPDIRLRSCRFVVPAGLLGSLVSDGSFSASEKLLIDDCDIDVLGDPGGTVSLFGGADVRCVGSRFDVSAATSGTIYCINKSGAKVAAAGNVISNSGGATVGFLTGTASSEVSESATAFGSGVTLLAFPGSAAVVNLASRRGRIYEVSHASGNLDFTDEAVEAETINIEITNSAAKTFLCTPRWAGQVLNVFWWNNAGGSIGTSITWGSGFAAQTVVDSQGFAPQTGSTAAGDIAAASFVACTGPDGLAFYPVAAYKGT